MYCGPPGSNAFTSVAVGPATKSARKPTRLSVVGFFSSATSARLKLNSLWLTSKFLNAMGLVRLKFQS
jgi:hypothetical protein